MKFRKRTFAYIAGALMLTTSIAACRHSTPEERGEKIVEKVAKELSLNDTQKTNLAEVKDELLEIRSTMKAQREQTQTTILTMLEQPVLDRDEANAIVNSYVDVINTRSPEIIEALGTFYDSLDDTQRSEIREFINDHQEHHRRHSW